MSHIETRRYLRQIANVAAFNEVINAVILSEQEKRLMQLHYIDKQDFRFIGDKLGLSESSVKRKHREILRTIERYIDK